VWVEHVFEKVAGASDGFKARHDPLMTSLHEDPRVRRGMERQLELRRRMLGGGARPVGWKLGLGTPAAMEKLGTAAPLVGFLTGGGLLEPGAACAIGDWGRPMAEPEVAIHVAADIPGGADGATAAAAIGGLGAAIELVDLGDASEVEEILAGDIFHRHVVLGPAGAGVGDGLRAEIRLGAADAKAVDDPYSLTGDPAKVVAHVATHLAAFGETLRAGEVIIAGSIVPALPVAPGDRLRYRLEPLAELTVDFAE
jgi:2-keto-4-pentenoate hydratase